MKTIVVIPILMVLALKGDFAVSLPSTLGLSSTARPMTTDSSQTFRPITPPPPPSPPPAPPSALFKPMNGSTVAPPTSMTPVMSTIILPTITITSLVPSIPSSMTPATVTTTPPVSTITPDIDECKENPCEQECVNTPGGYECQCSDGYMLQKDKKKCQDIDECNSIYNDCPVDRTECVNSNGGYSCECLDGYEKKGDDCVDIDECAGFFDPCPSNSACENTKGAYICNCNTGYFQEGDSCTNIDYCEIGNDCQQRCIDGTTAYTCDCYAGYTLNSDKKTCTDDGDSCSLICTNGYCVAGLLGDKCECSPGYETEDDNGTISCVDINECIPLSIPDFLLRKCDVRCDNLEGSYTCSCLNGQILAPDKRACIDIDECANDTLHNCAPPSEGGNCTNIEGPLRYKCSCLPGYQGNGRTCQVLDTCSEDPCEGENMLCDNYPGGRVCSCKPGFYESENGDCRRVEKTFATVLVMDGPKDIVTDDLRDKTSVAYLRMANETEISLETEFKEKYGSAFLRCRVASFDPGSIVANVETFFNSEFKDDLAGINKFLQDEAIYCDKSICNIGSISNIDISRTVVQDFDECHAVEEAGLCLPRSVCVNEVGSYACACVEGFTAIYSENEQVFCEDINECEQMSGVCSAKSNSFCVNTIGSYDCQCEPNFKDISGICASVCDIQECENGATCVVSNEGETPEAYCICPPGYEGEKCAERSELFKLAVGVGTTFIILSCLLFLGVIILACRNQSSKTYPGDQYIDEGWDESKGKGHEETQRANGGHGTHVSGHTNVVMIAGDNTETGPRYVTVPKEGPNGTALSTLKQPSGSTEIQVEPTSYF